MEDPPGGINGNVFVAGHGRSTNLRASPSRRWGSGGKRNRGDRSIDGPLSNRRIMPTHFGRLVLLSVAAVVSVTAQSASAENPPAPAGAREIPGAPITKQ